MRIEDYKLKAYIKSKDIIVDVQTIDFYSRVIHYYHEGNLTVTHFGEIELIKVAPEEDNRSKAEVKARKIVSRLFEDLTVEEFMEVVLLINQRLGETLESYRGIGDIIKEEPEEVQQ